MSLNPMCDQDCSSCLFPVHNVLKNKTSEEFLRLLKTSQEFFKNFQGERINNYNSWFWIHCIRNILKRNKSNEFVKLAYILIVQLRDCDMAKLISWHHLVHSSLLLNHLLYNVITSWTVKHQGSQTLFEIFACSKYAHMHFNRME